MLESALGNTDLTLAGVERGGALRAHLEFPGSSGGPGGPDVQPVGGQSQGSGRLKRAPVNGAPWVGQTFYWVPFPRC